MEDAAPPDPPAVGREAAWEDAFRAAADARRTLVLGDTDTGKTTLVTALANRLVGGGATVGVVDADVGQSEIGPPATIGLGLVATRVDRLASAEVVALHFVGSVSPARNLGGMIEGTARLLERGLALGLTRLLVDTPGLVRGDLGRALASLLATRLRPDAVVVIEREEECQGIVRALASSCPRIVRIPALSGMRPRGPTQRRRHREAKFALAFAGARPVRLDLARVRVTGRSLDAGALGAVQGRLVGLLDARGELLGLGILTAIDELGGGLSVHTVAAPERVASIEVGRDVRRMDAPGVRRALGDPCPDDTRSVRSRRGVICRLDRPEGASG